MITCFSRQVSNLMTLALMEAGKTRGFFFVSSSPSQNCCFQIAFAVSLCLLLACQNGCADVSLGIQSPLNTPCAPLCAVFPSEVLQRQSCKRSKCALQSKLKHRRYHRFPRWGSLKKKKNLPLAKRSAPLSGKHTCFVRNWFSIFRRL